MSPKKAQCRTCYQNFKNLRSLYAHLDEQGHWQCANKPPRRDSGPSSVRSRNDEPSKSSFAAGYSLDDAASTSHSSATDKPSIAPLSFKSQSSRDAGTEILMSPAAAGSCDLDNANHHNSSSSSKFTSSPNLNSSKSNLPVKCYHCPQRFSSAAELMAHKDEEHIIQCRFCPKMFPSVRAVLKHKIQKHPDVRSVGTPGLKCWYCPAAFDSMIKLKEHKLDWHQKIVVASQQIHCKFCPRVFGSFQEVVAHKRRDHPRGNQQDPEQQQQQVVFHCSLCPASFECRDMLTNHKIAVHDVNESYTEEDHSFQCRLCPALFRSEEAMLDHEQQEHGRENSVHDWLCPLCPAVFDSEEQLQCHEVNHHQCGTAEQPFYECMLCNVIYDSREELVRHERRHHEVPMDCTFSCNFCPAEFPSVEEVEEHMTQAHPRPGIFSCNSCRFEFASVEEVEEHIAQAHPRPEIFSCNSCRFEFASVEEVEEHMAQAHPRPENRSEMVECRYCHKYFPNLWEVMIHKRAVHDREARERQMESCWRCGEWFENMQLLIAHKNEQHWNKDPPLPSKQSSKADRGGGFVLICKFPQCDGALFTSVHQLDKHLDSEHKGASSEPTNTRADSASKRSRELREGPESKRSRSSSSVQTSAASTAPSSAPSSSQAAPSVEKPSDKSAINPPVPSAPTPTPPPSKVLGSKSTKLVTKNVELESPSLVCKEQSIPTSRTPTHPTPNSKIKESDKSVPKTLESNNSSSVCEEKSTPTSNPIFLKVSVTTDDLQTEKKSQPVESPSKTSEVTKSQDKKSLQTPMLCTETGVQKNTPKVTENDKSQKKSPLLQTPNPAEQKVTPKAPETNKFQKKDSLLETPAPLAQTVQKSTSASSKAPETNKYQKKDPPFQTPVPCTKSVQKSTSKAPDTNKPQKRDPPLQSPAPLAKTGHKSTSASKKAPETNKSQKKDPPLQAPVPCTNSKSVEKSAPTPSKTPDTNKPQKKDPPLQTPVSCTKSVQKSSSKAPDKNKPLKKDPPLQSPVPLAKSVQKSTSTSSEAPETAKRQKKDSRLEAPVPCTKTVEKNIPTPRKTPDTVKPPAKGTSLHLPCPAVQKNTPSPSQGLSGGSATKPDSLSLKRNLAEPSSAAPPLKKLASEQTSPATPSVGKPPPAPRGSSSVPNQPPKPVLKVKPQEPTSTVTPSSPQISPATVTPGPPPDPKPTPNSSRDLRGLPPLKVLFPPTTPKPLSLPKTTSSQSLPNSKVDPVPSRDHTKLHTDITTIICSVETNLSPTAAPALASSSKSAISQGPPSHKPNSFSSAQTTTAPKPAVQSCPGQIPPGDAQSSSSTNLASTSGERSPISAPPPRTTSVQAQGTAAEHTDPTPSSTAQASSVPADQVPSEGVDCIKTVLSDFNASLEAMHKFFNLKLPIPSVSVPQAETSASSGVTPEPSAMTVVASEPSTGIGVTPEPSARTTVAPIKTDITPGQPEVAPVKTEETQQNALPGTSTSFDISDDNLLDIELNLEDIDAIEEALTANLAKKRARRKLEKSDALKDDSPNKKFRGISVRKDLLCEPPPVPVKEEPQVIKEKVPQVSATPSLPASTLLSTVQQSRDAGKTPGEADALRAMAAGPHASLLCSVQQSVSSLTSVVHTLKQHKACYRCSVCDVLFDSGEAVRAHSWEQHRVHCEPTPDTLQAGAPPLSSHHKEELERAEALLTMFNSTLLMYMQPQQAGPGSEAPPTVSPPGISAAPPTVSPPKVSAAPSAPPPPTSSPFAGTTRVTERPQTSRPQVQYSANLIHIIPTQTAPIRADPNLIHITPVQTERVCEKPANKPAAAVAAQQAKPPHKRYSPIPTVVSQHPKPSVPSKVAPKTQNPSSTHCQPNKTHPPPPITATVAPIRAHPPPPSKSKVPVQSVKAMPPPSPPKQDQNYNYLCPLCPEAFSTQQELNKHKKKSHSLTPASQPGAPKPVTLCELCNVRFHAEADLLSHRELIHKVNKPAVEISVECSSEEAGIELPCIPCSACSETFSSTKVMRNHWRVVHSQQPGGGARAGSAKIVYECGVCKRQFSTESALREHQIACTPANYILKLAQIKKPKSA